MNMTSSAVASSKSARETIRLVRTSGSAKSGASVSSASIVEVAAIAPSSYDRAGCAGGFTALQHLNGLVSGPRGRCGRRRVGAGRERLRREELSRVLIENEHRGFSSTRNRQPHTRPSERVDHVSHERDAVEFARHRVQRAPLICGRTPERESITDENEGVLV